MWFLHAIVQWNMHPTVMTQVLVIPIQFGGGRQIWKENIVNFMGRWNRAGKSSDFQTIICCTFQCLPYSSLQRYSTRPGLFSSHFEDGSGLWTLCWIFAHRCILALCWNEAWILKVGFGTRVSSVFWSKWSRCQKTGVASDCLCRVYPSGQAFAC